jgi:hypothetical protein
MKTTILLMVAITLTGCVSEKTLLRNSTTGQTTRCDAWGFGVIGAPVAMASHSDCMKKAHEAGYSEN